MKQISSAEFTYHNETYELVKYDVVGRANWVVYTRPMANAAAVKLFEFTDMKYSYSQAQHMAKHMIRMYNAGKDVGQTEYRNKIYELIHG